MPTELDLRSYAAEPLSGVHNHAQLVLPIQGSVIMDITGRGAVVHPQRAAFVAPGLLHVASATGPKRSLVLDFDLAAVPQDTAARLCERPYASIGAPAAKLIDFIGLLRAQSGAGEATLAHWLPLLLESLARQEIRPASRLAAVLGQIEAHPGQAWSTEAMAKAAHMSVSSLHRAFRDELQTTPLAWLSELRLRWACRQLAHTGLPIARLATMAGYADQSALTHAMRRALDITPLAYRKRERQNQTKT
ncbi:helix-turn-helix domain-containing protein [Rugamonas sp. FT107W]|uniref:Helix-turn-helix domain-containing protein n=1 Tax=Duganella vulcania TaxID=2692166 RepID=A0A845HAT5_9BURK|nr:AraC family transcriptional regulator [Duganella vulcania]MYN15327.1 helix-turn-helix domain-containing protein [Duganella vulcania]